MKIFFKTFILTSLIFLLISCGNKKVVIDDKDLLSRAIVEGNKGSVEALLQKVEVGVNRRNLILQYFYMLEDKALPLIQSLMVTNTMVAEEQQAVFLKMHRDINSWVFLHEIYRLEVSKDIRLLQRDQLFLAPTNVKFDKCQLTVSESCAHNSRKELYQFMNQEQIILELKQMASKDPCVNLTQSLQGEDKANHCLQKRMGEVDVVLIKKPQYSFQEWREFLQ